MGAPTADAVPRTLGASAREAAPADIADQVRALPGVAKVTEATAPAGYRFFLIDFTQLVDHTSPAKGTFTQRITLLHKDVGRPMVMYTGGYNVSQNPSRSEPTQIVDGNQVSMEYRFFEPSRPAKPNWKRQLTIWQAATDQHVIIESFKRLYRQRWLTTGGSKGGMTATYHRRFYPRDVAGTVPYVAPNDVVDSKDVYNTFLNKVGNDPACRQTLTDLQRRTLKDRSWFLAKTRAVSKANNYTYEIVGTTDKAMESSIVDAPFAFWQYSTQADCATLPDPKTATNDQIWDFYENTSSLTGYADQLVSAYTPYYFQAAYQLGSPEPFENHIKDLLRYPGLDVAISFVPKDIRPKKFDKTAMPDIDKWVSTESRQMLYVYGGNDPWGAEAFTCGAKAAQRECARYFVAGGNHGSRIGQLPDAEKTRATALVLKWAGLGGGDQASKQMAAAGRPKQVPALDNVTPDYLRRGGM
ncbi:tripeptidyl aminopeptidase [Luteipulveratus mongoliensis]|uniref:Tripeptidyl aminopeptidase n=1 Tax=Luteipulveratus mongoliensis TaxID=571913 RepID=A0A0K1JPI8_9MICO|nr:tripeptidyl aminopeptidase [Luteipulveratus mongoliensis]